MSCTRTMIIKRQLHRNSHILSNTLDLSIIHTLTLSTPKHTITHNYTQSPPHPCLMHILKKRGKKEEEKRKRKKSTNNIIKSTLSINSQERMGEGEKSIRSQTKVKFAVHSTYSSVTVERIWAFPIAYIPS